MVTRRTATWPNLTHWGDAIDRQVNDLWSKLANAAPIVSGGSSYPTVNLWERGTCCTWKQRFLA
jgi:hypothetical protein